MARLRRTLVRRERTQKYVLVSDRVLPVLWSCAAERLAEAEQVLTTGRPE